MTPKAVPGNRRKPKWLIVASNIRHNLAARWRFYRGRVDSGIGATHLRMTPEQSIDYIHKVHSDYLSYGGMDASALEGKRILEVGPGDNWGVALQFYAQGASQVVCLDKFFSKRDEKQQSAIYRMLRDGLSDAERSRYDQAIDLGNAISLNEDAVRYVYGVGAENADGRFESESFDLIVSRAVIWEIFDTDSTLRALDRVLRPGGVMIHKIATCRDWIFTPHGYHPMEFMTISDPLYRLMASDSSKSNRRTIAYYRQAMQELGYAATFHITQVVGRQGAEFPPNTLNLLPGVHYTEDTLSLIRQIRSRLLPRFQKLTDADLMVDDMFVVAVKPLSASGSNAGRTAA